jgi:mitochondrial fission protein ELM1
VTASPRIWLLESEKLGDNAQLRVVADALGLAVESRRILVKPRYRFRKPFVFASLHHVDRKKSAVLEDPWPDLVLCTGRRMSMVALWIQKQSGGRTKLVLIGKPRRLLSRFDLVVAAAQYDLPERSNILRITLPLMRLDPAELEAEALAWKGRLDGLRRPLTAVLVGGPVRVAVFDASATQRLAEGVKAIAERDGGTLYVVTSRRTQPHVVEALDAALPEGSLLHRFDQGGDNPYRALLASADRFVVTSDSLSMMAEVARLSRPLSIFLLSPSRWSWGRLLRRPRDLAALPALLFERGLAVPLGEAFRNPAGPPPDELSEVAARIRALLAP